MAERQPTASIMNGRVIALTTAFLAFLYPIGVGDLSVNYSFVLFPVLVAAYYGRLQRPADVFLYIIALYLLVFAVASLYQYELGSYTVRRIISFVIFLSVFAFMFVKVDSDMIVSFKAAVVLISVAFSLKSMAVFYLAGADIGYEAKDLIGSQRYGFIYLIAFWLAYFMEPCTGWPRLARYAALFTLLTGLLLTFSRASIVALILPLAAYAATHYRDWMVRPSLRRAATIIGGVVAAVVAFVVLQRLVPLAFVFFGDRLFGFFSQSEVVTSHLADAETSEGTRVMIAKIILEHVARNPFTGAGYLGIWVIPDARVGSAHNQYTDVLLRTGVLGLIAYLYLLVRLARHLFARERALFWGLAAVSVYGLFHETFKESQGAFVLAFMLGMLAQGIRDGVRRRQGGVRASPSPADSPRLA